MDVTNTLVIVAALSAGAVAVAVGQGPQQVRHASVLKGAYTQEQAKRGKEVFEVECSSCHGPTEFSNAEFMEGWRDKPLGAFYGLVRGTMPEGRPGGLREQQYVDFVAYVLELNGYPSGDSDLPVDRAVLTQLRFDKPQPAATK